MSIQGKTPQEISDNIARSFFGVEPDPAARKTAAIHLLIEAAVCAVLVPALFYLNFGEVGDLGWGMTVFCVAYCILAAVGLYFGVRPEYHTTVQLRGGWADRVGAFWLVSCAFGPFFGWVLTSIVPLTVTSWRWVYGVRFFLAAGLPIITALPILRYVRGKAARVALPLLLGVTMLAIWSVVNVGRDLLNGPVMQQVHSSGQIEMVLKFTAQSLGVIR
jgi:hypothetical protein